MPRTFHMPSIPEASYLPIPRIRLISKIGYKAMASTTREVFMTSLVEEQPRLYRLIESDKLKERYQDDEATLAIASMGNIHRSTSWTFSWTDIERVRYVGTIPRSSS